MTKILKTLAKGVALLVAWTAFSMPAWAQPTADDAMVALTDAFLKLAEYDGEQRTVLFETVTPGAPNGGSYPFRVTLTLHDYIAGYPANGYYGRTCLMRFHDEVFVLSADGFGGWQVNGRMSNIDDNQCIENPAEGVMSIPLDSVPGQSVAGMGYPNASTGGADGALATGQWVCWSASNLIASIYLYEDGSYADTGSNYGQYLIDGERGTIQFSGAALDGLVGTDLSGRSFYLGDNVLCEPS